MKKLLNVLGVLLALAAVGFGFVSCDNDVSGVSGGRAITAFTAEQNGETITFKWKVRGVSDNDIDYFKLSVSPSWQGVNVYPPTSSYSHHWEKDGDWFVYEDTPTFYGSRQYTAHLKGVLSDGDWIFADEYTFDYTAPSED